MKMTNFEYNLLFLFKICADSGSFSKASQELHVKQPAISYSIKKLEDLLDIKLFDRTKFGIKLTNEGKILYDYIKEANNNIVSGLKTLEEMSSKEVKQLKIGSSLNLAVVWLPEIIKKINKMFPNVIVSIESQGEEEMLEKLQERKLDVVIFNTSKYIPIKGINICKVKNTEVVLVGIKKYKDIIESNKKRKEMIPIIMPGENSVIGKSVAGKLETSNINLKNTIRCSSAILAKELLLQGLGIGYINKATVANEIENKELYIINDDINIDIHSIYFATQLKNNNGVVEKFKKIFIEEVNK